MLKYVNTDIVFSEIPDETTLAINISNCPCRCPGCHSGYLWQDIGNPLDAEALEGILSSVEADITCVAFMGGDAEPNAVSELATYLHSHHPQLSVAWYSGRVRLNSSIDKQAFNYIKIGPYIRHLGPLNMPTTNQRLYKRTAEGTFQDITSRLWKT